MISMFSSTTKRVWIDRLIHKLESDNEELEKENDRLNDKKKELMKECEKFSAALSIGNELNRTIVAQLQEIINRTASEPMEVVGFSIDTQKMNLTSPIGGPIEHEVEQYVVKIKNSRGETLSVVAKKDDYYNAPEQSLQRRISQLFANLNGPQRKVMHTLKKPKKKTEIRMG